MDYVITFSDVMAGVITLGLGVITFFIKGWFNNLKSSTEEIKKQIKENDDKVNKRIDKLEEETDRDIANIKQELNDIKGDFATTFVLREDFFRSMNGVEDRMRSIDSKIDKLLMQSNRKFLKGEGYDISKSSVGRYATRTNNAMQRLLEAQAQTDRLIQVVKENPEADYTEAAILLTMNGLLNKVATAEEEFNEMPLDKAGRLIASLSRTKVYKDRVKQDMRRKADIAFREMESEMLKVIKQDEKSAAQLKEILAKAKERMMEDD